MRACGYLFGSTQVRHQESIGDDTENRSRARTGVRIGEGGKDKVITEGTKGGARTKAG